jgi:hypothetical protein
MNTNRLKSAIFRSLLTAAILLIGTAAQAGPAPTGSGGAAVSRPPVADASPGLGTLSIPWWRKLFR